MIEPDMITLDDLLDNLINRFNTNRNRGISL